MNTCHFIYLSYFVQSKMRGLRKDNYTAYKYSFAKIEIEWFMKYSVK